jgi:transcriptional regulator with XRE-family HTH domain
MGNRDFWSDARDWGMVRPPKTQSPDEIGARLKSLRIALGFEVQADFCRHIGLSETRYNSFETGARRLTLQAADHIKAATGVTLDYLFYGDTGGLPLNLSHLILRAA